MADIVWRDSWCKKCGQYFQYPAKNWNGRKRKYCDKHDADTKKEQNRQRVSKFRSEKAKHKQPSDDALRPVSVGEAKPRLKPKGGGLFASSREPIRTNSRTRFGLPS